MPTREVANLPRQVSGGGDKLEKVELSIFDTGDEFDTIVWMNDVISKHNVDYDKLESWCGSLSTMLLLLTQDTSEAIEVSTNKMTSDVPSLIADFDRLRCGTAEVSQRLSAMRGNMADVTGQTETLQWLVEGDNTRQRLEKAKKALGEVHHWDRRLRDLETLVHGGNLSQVLKQLDNLKEGLAALEMLPEFQRRTNQVKVVEDQVCGVAKRKIVSAIARRQPVDLQMGCGVYQELHRGEQLMEVFEVAFQNAAETIWKEAPEGAFGDKVMTFFSDLETFLAEVWPMVRSAMQKGIPHSAQEEDTGADIATEESPQPNSSNPNASDGAEADDYARLLAPAIAAAVAVIATNDDAHVTLQSQPGQAGQILQAYRDGFTAVCRSDLVRNRNWLWKRACADERIIPQIVLSTYLQNAHVALRRESDNCSPSLEPDSSIDAISSDAENKACQWFALVQVGPHYAPGSGADASDGPPWLDSGLGCLAPSWLACVDLVGASYWSSWQSLVENFATQVGRHHGPFDPSMLTAFLQFHDLVCTMQRKVNALEGDCLRKAQTMSKHDQPCAFSTALQCFISQHDGLKSLAVPSIEAVGEAAQTVSSRLVTNLVVLPKTVQSLEVLKTKAAAVVAQCCVMPIMTELGNKYRNLACWKIHASGDLSTADWQGKITSPTPEITAVGEHVFSLVPQLENAADGSGSPKGGSSPNAGGAGGSEGAWLALIVPQVIETVVQKMLLIECMTPAGAQQLAQDLKYLLKVGETFCTEPVMELIHFMNSFQKNSSVNVLPEGMEAPQASSSVTKSYDQAMRRWFASR